jgi:hypothetical protein
MLAAPLPANPPPAAPDAHPHPLRLTPAGRQWLDVSGTVVDRFLVTYRADAAALARLVPPPFELDVFAGHGFVSVCALEVEGMGLRRAPGFLRWRNRELLYRLGVRLRGEPTFLTLRSDVSSRPLAWLGRWFSHHRPFHARVELTRQPGRVAFACRTPDGAGDASLVLDPRGARASTSVFGDAATAAGFLVGMSLSADALPGGGVRVQTIDHDPWDARFVSVLAARFAYLEALARAHEVRLVYDNTLGMHGIRQIWRAAR